MTCLSSTIDIGLADIRAGEIVELVGGVALQSKPTTIAPSWSVVTNASLRSRPLTIVV